MKAEENNVIITKYGNVTKEGIVLSLNIPTTLKTGKLASKEFYVSWDKIGKALFDNYAHLDSVDEYRKLRGIESQQPEQPREQTIEAVKKSIEPKPDTSQVDQSSEEFAKMKNGSFMQIGCIDTKKDLWANINCQNHIDPATCKRETSCSKCDKYKVVYTEEAINHRASELAKIHAKQSVGDFAVGYLFGIKEHIKF